MNPRDASASKNHPVGSGGHIQHLKFMIFGIYISLIIVEHTMNVAFSNVSKVMSGVTKIVVEEAKRPMSMPHNRDPS